MSFFTIFGNSFLDGFTIAGFLNRLGHPGRAKQMFASKPIIEEPGWHQVIFQPVYQRPGQIMVAGNLHNIPEPELQAMIDVLKLEEMARKESSGTREGAVRGSSR